MTGWVYLIRNGDLYKIGITKSLHRRMKQLKPDEIMATIQTDDFRYLEKQLHTKFKHKRIPQSEYFRLNKEEVKLCKQILSRDHLKNSFQGVKVSISYLLGTSLIITAISPAYQHFLKIKIADVSEMNINVDYSYPIRLISGAWLIILGKNSQKRKRNI